MQTEKGFEYQVRVLWECRVSYYQSHCPVICGGEVRHHLIYHGGVDPSKVRAVCWGLQVVEYALTNHYSKAKGNPDVEKFVTLVQNLHSDEGPVVKPVVLEPGEVWYYPTD